MNVCNILRNVSLTVLTCVGPYKIRFIFSQIPFYFFPNSFFSILIFGDSIFSILIFMNPDLLSLYYQKQCVFNVND